MLIRSLLWKRVGVVASWVVGLSSAAYAADGDALETAKKELQTLPAAEVSTSTGETGIDGKKFDFALSPSSGGSGPGPNSSASEQSVSQGWLLDALQKPAATGDDRFGTKKEIANAHAEDRLQANQETAKTWSPFLQQWLLPQNRSLTTGGLDFGASPRDKNAGDDFLKAQIKSKAALGLNEPLTGNATYRDPLAQRPNPYLDENAPTNVWPGSHDFTSPSSGQTNSPATLSHPFPPISSDPYPAHGDDKTDAARKSEAQLPPPTMPLVDEQKYFPQLDRF